MRYCVSYVSGIKCKLCVRYYIKEFFETLNKSSRYVIACGLINAKKPETRLRRFTKFMNMLAHEEKPK